MKKIFSFLIILTLVGCGGSGLTSTEKDVYEIYEKAVENLSTYDSYEINDNINLTLIKDDESRSATIVSQIQAVNNSKDFYYTLGDTKTNIGLYYKDGNVYTTILNNNVKAPIPKLIMNVKNVHLISKLNKKAMITGSEKSTSSGKELTLEFSASSIETIIDKLKLDEESDTKIESIKSGTVNVVMNVDNDNILVNQTLNFDIICNVRDKNNVASEVKLVVNTIETVNGVNSTTIDFPSDLDSYKSLSVDKIKEFLTEFGIL